MFDDFFILIFYDYIQLLCQIENYFRPKVKCRENFRLTNLLLSSVYLMPPEFIVTMMERMQERL